MVNRKPIIYLWGAPTDISPAGALGAGPAPVVLVVIAGPQRQPSGNLGKRKSIPHEFWRAHSMPRATPWGTDEGKKEGEWGAGIKVLERKSLSVQWSAVYLHQGPLKGTFLGGAAWLFISVAGNVFTQDGQLWSGCLAIRSLMWGASTSNTLYLVQFNMYLLSTCYMRARCQEDIRTGSEVLVLLPVSMGSRSPGCDLAAPSFHSSSVKWGAWSSLIHRA